MIFTDSNETAQPRQADQLVTALPPLQPAQEALWTALKAITPVADSDDHFVREACIHALIAAAEGNHGVGAVIVHRGRIVTEGRNHALRPHVRSDLHAEMDALNAFERECLDVLPSECTLYSSLECCPMCTVRLINVGIGRVLYAADDAECGMVSRFADLPAGYREMAASRTPPQHFGRADCSESLADCAHEIFRLNLDALNDATRQRANTLTGDCQHGQRT
ncbi:tRNA-Xxx [Candidatus Paraburkholderia calva]|nr:tRNA-Xxx [Candidatus Paraburkholderia calva]